MKRQIGRGAIAAGVASAALLLGCGDSTLTDPAMRRAAYASGDRTVGAVRLSKPADDPDLRPAFLMAPLVVDEAGDGSGTGVGVIGAARPDGALSGVGDEATVYVERSAITVAGREHARWTYVWWYVSAPMRGVRMTLHTDGFPAVYEILGDSQGLRRVFVSRELDEAAAGAFGPPLPGRSFASERSVADTPAVVVLDTVEPGSSPLGPFVYFALGSRDAFALHCRCAPSRMAEVTETVEYRLAPLDALPATWSIAAPRLESLLRLPPTDW